MKLNPWWLAILAFAAIGVSGGSAGASGPEIPGGGNVAGRKDLWRMLEGVPQLDDTQRKFLMLVARGESGFDSRVGLGDPALFPPGTKPNTSASEATQANEAKAARGAFDQHADYFAQCGLSRESFSFGSGGWFGMLPAYGVYHLRNTPLACWPAASVFDPARAIVMAISHARGLQGYDGFQHSPTVANLRAGWGVPSRMSKPMDPDRRAKYAAHAQSFGLPASFVDEHVSRFPKDYVAIYQALTGGAGVS